MVGKLSAQWGGSHLVQKRTEDSGDCQVQGKGTGMRRGTGMGKKAKQESGEIHRATFV